MRKNHTKFYNNNNKKFQQEQPFGLQVVVFDGNVEQALRKLKKKIANSGLLLLEVKKREAYEKPTQKRKVQKAMAVKREKKRLEKELLPPKRGYSK